MKVDAMIIGAGRSGTTTVFEYMKQHDSICFSITKEVHYFSLQALYERGEKYFHSLFSCKEAGSICTADTYLLMDTEAPDRIRKYNQKMKFIVLLREPVARAYSNYSYAVNFGHEKKGISFLATIPLESLRLANENIAGKNNLCHCYGSLYHKHLSYWTRFFPRDQFLLLKTEDLQRDPQRTMDAVFQFLGVAPFRIQLLSKQNESASARSKFLQQVLLNRDHPMRKATRWMIRPFRNLIIKSGVIEKLSAMNKTKSKRESITEAEAVEASKYFSEDLRLLSRDFGIRFGERDE